jgi:hypothetical protein
LETNVAWPALEAHRSRQERIHRNLQLKTEEHVKFATRRFVILAFTAVSIGRAAAAQQVDRTVLPIPEPQPPSITELSARDVKPPARYRGESIVG